MWEKIKPLIQFLGQFVKRDVVILCVLMTLVGMVLAYVAFPTVYYDGDPRSLHQSWQDEWVKMLADRYASANVDVSGNITDLLMRVDNPVEIVNRLITSSTGEEQSRFQAILPFAEQAQPNAVTAPAPSIIGSIIPFILAAILIAVLAVIWMMLWGFYLQPVLSSRKGKATGTDASLAADKAAFVAAKQAQALKTDFTTTDYGAPLKQYMSAYVQGRGQYDDSFSIEDANEMFLGECGAGISETIGVGEPTKVTAIEVWLFDKEDFVRTITNVFVSEHAANDPALRSKLEQKGDLVVAKPGAVAVLETNTLRLQARIVEMDYGSGPLPPNSYFEKMTIELAAWRKDANSAPVALGTSTVTVNAPVAFNPPTPATTPMPAYQPPPAVPTYQPPPPAPSPASFGTAPRPASPPVSFPPPSAPAPRSPVQDDDPFGGTGDFTPIG